MKRCVDRSGFIKPVHNDGGVDGKNDVSVRRTKGAYGRGPGEGGLASPFRPRMMPIKLCC